MRGGFNASTRAGSYQTVLQRKTFRFHRSPRRTRFVFSRRGRGLRRLGDSGGFVCCVLGHCGRTRAAAGFCRGGDLLTPTYQVSANGADLTAKLKTCLISLTISDETGINSDSVEIEIDDRDGAVAIPPFGADLVVGIGYTETGIVAKGRFRVDEIETSGADRRMLIRARSADTNAVTTLSHIKAAVFRSWVGKTIADVAGTLAKENGWGAVLITDEIIANAKTPTDQQTGQSDLDYLKLIARDSGGQVKPANGQLLRS